MDGRKTGKEEERVCNPRRRNRSSRRSGLGATRAGLSSHRTQRFVRRSLPAWGLLPISNGIQPPAVIPGAAARFRKWRHSRAVTGSGPRRCLPTPESVPHYPRAGPGSRRFIQGQFPSSARRHFRRCVLRECKLI